MAVTLKDMIKKAEDKGYSTETPSSNTQIIKKPWQQNSVIYSENTQKPKVDNKEKTTHKTIHKPHTNHTQTKHKKQKRDFSQTSFHKIPPSLLQNSANLLPRIRPNAV